MTARAVSIFSKRVLLPDWSLKPALLKTDGSKIISVEAMDEPPCGLPDLLDVGDRPVTPAFVNSHTHLPMAALRGIEGCAAAMAGDVVKDLYFQVEQKMSQEDVRAFARMGSYECLLSGTGLVWEHYYHGRGLADALLETGLAGVVCPTLQDLSGPGVPWLEAALKDTEDIAKDPNLKSSGIFAAFGPHATDTVSDKLWQEIVVRSKALGDLPVHSHVAQCILEFETVHASTGGTPFMKLKTNGVLSSGIPLLLVHAQFATSEDAALLDKDKHVLCVCPRSHMLFLFPTSARQWHALGIRISLGTDAAASNDDMNVQTELRMLAGLSSFEATSSQEAQAMWSATSKGEANGATVLNAARALQARRQAAHDSACSRQLRDDKQLLRAVWDIPGTLHPDFRAGVIEAGALANIVIWDAEHPSIWPAKDFLHALVMCDAALAIDGLMVCGRWIGRAPEPAGPDGLWQKSIRTSETYKKAVKEATSRLESLLAAVGLTAKEEKEDKQRGVKRPLGSD